MTGKYTSIARLCIKHTTYLEVIAKQSISDIYINIICPYDFFNIVLAAFFFFCVTVVQAYCVRVFSSHPLLGHIEEEKGGI